MAEIPNGYKFHPADQELISYYLFNKVTGKPLPCEGVVTELNLYGDEEPWQIFEGVEERVCYFFTKLKKKTGNGTRFDRTVGIEGDVKGTWKAQDEGKPILDDEGIVIGWKKSFVYEKKGSMKHSGYIMKEYSLDGNCKDYVLCQVKRKDEGERRVIVNDKSMEADKSIEPNQSNIVMEKDAWDVDLDELLRLLGRADD